MDRDDFIITVYSLVCEPSYVLQSASSRWRGGFDPVLTDADVIPRELCGASCKRSTKQDLGQYVRTHSHHFFPAVGDRPRLVRPAAHLWPRKAAQQQRLTDISRHAQAPLQPIDPLP